MYSNNFSIVDENFLVLFYLKTKKFNPELSSQHFLKEISFTFFLKSYNYLYYFFSNFDKTYFSSLWQRIDGLKLSPNP